MVPGAHERRGSPRARDVLLSSAAAEAWFAALRELAAGPLPSVGSLSPGEERQRRIVGGSLIQWVQVHGPDFLAERAALAELLGIEPDPFVVFVSTLPGLIAAEQILGRDHPRVVAVAPEVFEAFLRDHPDPAARYHVHLWSLFDCAPGEAVLSRARTEYPIADGETYWVHLEGTDWAENAGRGGEHLWAWDGAELLLLQEAFTSWTR
jgi:hypothetical protein